MPINGIQELPDCIVEHNNTTTIYKLSTIMLLIVIVMLIKRPYTVLLFYTLNQRLMIFCGMSSNVDFYNYR